MTLLHEILTIKTPVKSENSSFKHNFTIGKKNGLKKKKIHATVKVFCNRAQIVKLMNYTTVISMACWF